MSKKVKKAHHFLAWFLGFLFGLFFPLIALVTAIFVVQPAMISPSTEHYLGDLASLSFGNIAIELVNKVSSEGTNYTLGDLMEDYNIDPDKMSIEVAQIFGNEEVKSISIGALMSGNGVETFLEVTPANLVVSIADFYFGANASNIETALEGVTLAQLINFEDLENGTAKALEDVKLVWLVPELAQGDNAVLQAVAESTVGNILAGVLSDNIYAELKEDGHLSLLGSLTFVEILGNIDESMENILGDKAIADLINDDDQLDVLGILYGIQFGTLLNYTNVGGVWYNASNQEIGGIEKVLADIYTDDLLGGEFDVDTILGDAYLGDLLGYTKDNDTWLDVNGNQIDSLMKTLADLQIGDFLGGDFDINNLFGDLYIGELLGYTKDGDNWFDANDNQVDSLMSALSDIQIGDLLGGEFDVDTILGDLYIGEMLGYTKDGDNWFDANDNQVDSLMS
ncbi:MAG: hypothetical protein J6R37_02425, partial [Clostridia bacterium]|nr:hypothetical protein [Clostridia bacterium]